MTVQSEKDNVAPVRERGLKSSGLKRDCTYNVSRSREGAWIEIKPGIGADYFDK